jgi:F-type H+-transporting ATPase subunit delta
VKISKQARRDARQLFHACTAGGLLDETKVRRTVEGVIAGKPRGYVGILSHFERLVKMDMARRTARVESATPLTSAMQGSITSSLARRYGAGLNLSFSQNPALIGGLRIKVGSDVFDGSIHARLNALAESF